MSAGRAGSDAATFPPPPVKTVTLIDRFKQLNYKSLYAGRMVDQISSKGRAQRRVLLVTNRCLALVSAKLGLRVRRYVKHEHIIRVMHQQRKDGLWIVIKLKEESGEPDILFSQLQHLENPPPTPPTNGSDLVDILRWCWYSITGSALPVHDWTGMKVLDQNNCSLTKSAAWSSPKLKVVQGDLRSPPPAGDDDKSTSGALGGRERSLEAASSTSSGSASNSSGGGTYVIHLQDPRDELGIRWEDAVQRILIVGVDPGTPAAAAGLPLGILQSVNGHPTDSPAALHTVFEELSAAGTLKYKCRVAPTPEFPEGKRRKGCVRVLAVGVTYEGTNHHLPNAASDARTAIQALESMGFCEDANVRLLLQEPGADEPTKANIVKNIQWLMDGVAPGDALFFCFVGHCMQQNAWGLRDGPDEALYPSDFNTPGIGVISEGELRAMLVDPLPAGAKLTVVCDSCGAGALLDLPYKLKATPDGGTHSSFDGEGKRAPIKGRVAQLSAWAPPSARPLVPVLATGTVVVGFCDVMASVPEPTFSALLSAVFSASQRRVGTAGSGQVPQVACSWRASTSEVFFPAVRRGMLGRARKQQFTPPLSPQHRTPQHQVVQQEPQPQQPQEQQLEQKKTPPYPWQPGRIEHLASLHHQAYPPALPPDELFSKVPRSVLDSPGLSKLLTVQWINGVPEIFFASEVIVMEARGDKLWPNAKLFFVGREAMYVLEPNGEVDRCIPLHDVNDFIMLKDGASLDSLLPNHHQRYHQNSSGQPWLAVRVPSQFELLFQPIDKAGNGQEIQNLIQVVNALLQHGNVSLQGGGEPAKVLLLDDSSITSELLRLARPPNYSFPWVPLNVRIWPSDVPLSTFSPQSQLRTLHPLTV